MIVRKSFLAFLVLVTPSLSFQLPVHNRITQSPLFVSIDAPPSTPWWQSYTLLDPSLPTTVRPDFPILHTSSSSSSPLVYLDSAATSQKPLCVTDELTSYYLESNANVHRGAHSLSQKATALYESARDTVADFVCAERDEIVFTSGATHSINLVARCTAEFLSEGDEVLSTVMEHHSNIVPWEILAKERNARLRFVPLSDDGFGVDWSLLPTLLSSKTKMVCLQHSSNVMGVENPLEDILPLVRSLAPNAKVLLDACQSAPHRPLDVRALGVDYLVASGHKLCGPTGVGFLWGANLNELPPFMGGGEMIDTVSATEGVSSTWAPPPARFEAGTPPIAQAVGMARAMEYLQGIGMDRIRDYVGELGKYMHRRMREVEGVEVLGPQEGRDGGIVAFVCKGAHPADVSAFLDVEGVAIRAGHHCCQPLHRALGYTHSARASLYFYNTKEEVDVFVDKLEETLVLLRSMA